MLQLFNLLIEKKSNRIFIAAFIGLIFFHLFYGLQTLNPTNISWLLTVKHDWGTHYLGWHFFKNEAWHFPLGEVQNYFAPLGTNIGFTDSIPLVALFFKLFAPILPEDFQYFGWWFLLCYFLTAYFTLLLLRLFKLKPIIILLGVILVTGNPVLVYRGLHPSLCAQWLLIACLYFYFIDTRFVKPLKFLNYQLLLLALSALITPYLCFMVLGFSICTAIKYSVVEKSITKLNFAVYLFLSVALLLVLWWALGIFSFNSKEDISVAGGYGLYGMNLNSLYNSDGYSSFLPQLKQVSSRQYEGYMYLGLGMILLIALLFATNIVSLVSKKVQPVSFWSKNKQHLPLFVLMLLFALFSITHVVTFNSKTLFTIPLPIKLIQVGDIFRASARFFWPIYYLLFLFLLVKMANAKMGEQLKMILLSLIVLIQLYDIKLFFNNHKLTYGTYNPPIENANWTELMKNFDRIVFYPPFETNYKESMDYQYFCYLAAKLNKPINIGYVSRLDNAAAAKYKDSLLNALIDGELAEENLYITTVPFVKNFYGATLNILDGYCYFFSDKIKELGLLNLSDELNKTFQKTVDSVSAIMNQRISFSEASITTPLSEKKIHYQIEGLTQKKKYIFIKGWAFKEETQNNKGDSVFITLTSPLKSYIAAVSVVLRQDVTEYFKKTYLNDAGFSTAIYKTMVQKGVYKLGLLIKDAIGNKLNEYTDQVITVGIPEYGTMQKIPALPSDTEIKATLEKSDVTDSLVQFSGWGFLENQHAYNSEISFVLLKDKEMFTSAVIPVQRPDVKDYFKNGFNIDNSGFVIKYLKAQIPKGKYKTGVIIKDIITDKERVYLFVNEVDIK